MQNYYIAFSSVTYAVRVKDAFKFDGSHISMLHTPKHIPVNGCSYSLKVSQGKVKDIVKKAKEMNIVVKGVFVKTENGFEEVLS